MTTFTITESAKTNFEKKMKKFSNRAAKLGIEFGYKLLGTEEKTAKDENGHDVFWNVYNFEVWGDAPVIAGYTFIAKIEPVEEGLNFVHTHNVELDLSSYRSAKLVCEHCNRNVYRKFYFVIADESGSQKMIGHNCLANYIGSQDAEAIANFYASFIEAEDDEDDNNFDGNVSSSSIYSVTDYMNYVVESVNRRGYVSSKNADETMLSTKSDAIIKMFEPVKNFRVEITNEIRENAAKIISTVIENLNAKTNLNEYEFTVKTLLQTNHMDINRHAGYVSSVIALYNKIIDAKFENKIQSDYVGTVGEKIENIEAKFSRYNKFQGAFGITHIYTFDANGNIMTWFSSVNVDIELGDNVIITKATVKEHKVSDYSGQKETIITRAKVAKV